MIFRGSGSILLGNPIFLWFFRGSGPPVPTLDPPMACIWKKVLVWNVPFSVWWSSDAKSDHIITLGMLVCPWSGTTDYFLDPNCLQTLIAGRKSRERERDFTVFAHKSFVLAWFHRISKHNVNLYQLIPMRTQSPNLSCASAFVWQSRTYHSINA